MIQQRHILHCDCNSFYASVEMQENPDLRGKRIAVCGSKEDRHGIVLTASYPAKHMGVKTGMAIWQAQQCCRDLIIVPPHYTEYMRYSGYVQEILQDYSDQIEGFGLDESWVDISGSTGLFGSPMTIAQEISDRVKRELGITVSIGVSNNKVTAKLGSDYKKPDAITRIETDNYKEIVYPLPVQDLLYVGPATQKKLNSYAIRTIGQLAETDPQTLQGWFGKIGYTLSAFARGLDASPVARQDHTASIKSVGNADAGRSDLHAAHRHHLPLPAKELCQRHHGCSQVSKQNYCLTPEEERYAKACLTLAKRWGLIDDDSFSALECRRTAKNAQAEKAEQDGKPVYGTRHFSAPAYLQYELTRFKLDFVERREKIRALGICPDFTDAQTRAWYDANPDLFTRYAGDSFPYEEVKQIIEKRMREEVYDSLVQDLLRESADRQ